jgi:hypothetical protein
MNASFNTASESLLANIIQLPSGPYLVAGQNQFLTLWTRDFCHSVQGLLILNREDVVENHLSVLLKSKREDGLIPRVLDNKLVQARVAWQTVRHLLPFLPKMSFKDPLRPQFVDEHGSVAIDSNILFLRAALQFKQTPPGQVWWTKNEDDLKKVHAYYDDKFHDGLIKQEAFSDWQDSAKREGKIYLTNLLYFMITSELQDVGWDLSFDRKKFGAFLIETYMDTRDGLFSTLPGSAHICLEANLFSIESKDFLDSDQKSRLWSSLKINLLVSRSDGTMGSCSYPDYPRSQLAWHVKLARLHGYHGYLAWSWLIGLALKTAILMEDKEQELKQRRLISIILSRDNTVLEIYNPRKEWVGWSSRLLSAERPFSWGAAYLVDALKNVNR